MFLYCPLDISGHSDADFLFTGKSFLRFCKIVIALSEIIVYVLSKSYSIFTMQSQNGSEIDFVLIYFLWIGFHGES